jgi:hypothetical protein
VPITSPCDRPLIWRYLINRRITIASALAGVATTAVILAHQEIAIVKMESTVTIARPVEEGFRFFLDLDRNARKADPNVESVTKTPEGPTRPGTTFLFRQRALGAMRETATTFVSIEPNRRIEIDARLGPLRPKGAIGFDQTNLGTTVTVRLNPNLLGRSSFSRQCSRESARGSGTRGWRGSRTPLSVRPNRS